MEQVSSDEPRQGEEYEVESVRSFLPAGFAGLFVGCGSVINANGCPVAHASMEVWQPDAADNVLGNLNLIRASIGFGLISDYAASILPKGVVVKPLAWSPAPAAAW